jgi:putative flippase GtrA
MPSARPTAAAPVLGVVTLDVVLSSLWERYGAKLFRYCGVSAFNVVFGQSLLAVFYTVLGWPAWWANLLAVCISAGPAYWLSRHWVWEQSGTHSVRSEIAPFWGMALLGLAISTITTSFADHRWHTGLAVQAASIAAFGAVWLFKFLVLEHVMWKQPVEVPSAT